MQHLISRLNVLSGARKKLEAEKEQLEKYINEATARLTRVNGDLKRIYNESDKVADEIADKSSQSPKVRQEKVNNEGAEIADEIADKSSEEPITSHQSPRVRQGDKSYEPVPEKKEVEIIDEMMRAGNGAKIPLEIKKKRSVFHSLRTKKISKIRSQRGNEGRSEKVSANIITGDKNETGLPTIGSAARKEINAIVSSDWGIY